MNTNQSFDTNPFSGSANTLIGPLKSDPNFENILSSYEILGDYSASPEVMTFSGMELTNKEFIDTSFKFATAALPVNWPKDKVIFWGIDNEIIPNDLEKSNCPVIGVVFNWHYAFESIINNISRFDWIFTDKKGEQIFKNAGFNNVSSIMLRGFSPYVHRKLPEIKKDIDVSFIGDLNPAIHQERTKYVYKIAKFADQYNIKVFTKIYGDKYVNMVNHSKISLNVCSNQRVNQRCFEIPACNSLLFVQDDNLEIRDYFTDREDCVLYNEDNFEELIEFYLKNDEERERVTRNGFRKVQQYSFENLFEKLLEEINNLDLSSIRKNRTFSQLDRVTQHKAKAKQALQSTVPGKFYFVEKEIKAAIKNLSVIDPELSNNLGVINANAYFALSDKSDKSILTASKNSFNEAIGYSPTYAVARFNLACLHYMEEDYEKAEQVLNTLLVLISTEPEKALENTGFVYIIPNLSFQTDFKLAWEKITYENYNNESEKKFGYCDLLFIKTFEMLGNISEKNGDLEQAEEFYNNALQIREDIGESKFNLAKILRKLKRLDEAYLFLRELFYENPLDLEISKELLETLKEMDKKEEYNELAKELKIVARVSVKYNKYINMINFI